MKLDNINKNPTVEITYAARTVITDLKTLRTFRNQLRQARLKTKKEVSK